MKIIFNRRWKKEITSVGLGVFVALLAMMFTPWAIKVFAVVANNGTLVYSDNSTASTKWRTLTNPSTFGAETSDGLGLSTDAAQVVIKASPTRDEKMIGYLFDDGTLRIRRCVGGCDAAADWSTQLTLTGSTTAANTDKRAFDIIYESRTGDALVVFTDDPTTGKAYYCQWNGTSWSPATECAATMVPGAANEIPLTDGTTTMTGVPWRVRLKPMASNEAWLMVEDANADLYVVNWTGSAWDTASDIVATTTLSCDDNAGTNVDAGQCFTIDEESLTGTAVLFYTTGTPLIYRTFDGANWSGETTGATLAGAGNWLHATADPLSDRVALINGDQGNDVRTYMWKADGTTASFTAGQFDTAAESMVGDNVNVAWERGVGQTTRTALYVYTDNNGLVTTYSVTTCDGTGCTFGAFTAATGSCLDDCDRQLLVASPNGDEMMNIKGDIDSELKAQRWNGTGWDTISAGLTTAGALTPGTTNTNHPEMSFDFAYKPYSPWSRNWRFYQNNNLVQPSVALANENIAPSGITAAQQVRLRFQFEERAGMGQSGTTARKRLQYVSATTCPDPDNCSASNWTGVDAQGGAGTWRHFNATPADDAAITASLLTTTGCTTTQLGRYYEQNATTTAFTNTSLNCAEHDYVLQYNGAENGATYYFRMYDEDQAKPVRRIQVSGTGQCAGSTACAYPSIAIAGTAGPTVDQIMRHGNWFNGGAEQSFFWAN